MNCPNARWEDANEGLSGSEAHYESILGAIGDGVIARDASGRAVYANEAAARILDHPSARALLGRSTEEALSGFEVTDESGRLFSLEELPVQGTLRGKLSAKALMRLRAAATGEERWMVAESRPVLAST
jgi:PAS domain-containing protein